MTKECATEWKVFIAVATFISCLACSVSASAEDKPSEDFYDVTLTSLSKRTEDAFDAPAAVHIITSEDIRRTGATSLPDVLRLSPGIQVSQQNAHTWSVSARGFGSQFTNKLLVIVDGRVIYKPLFSGVFWDVEDVPLETIDRIEIIRGPGGTIWGSNAVNGVINIITKKAFATQGNRVTTEFGSRGEKSVTATHGATLASGNSYRLFAHTSDHADETLVNGQSADDNWELANAGFRYDITHLDNDTVTIHGDFKDAKSNNYFAVLPTVVAPFSVYSPDDKNQKNGNIVAKWDHTIDSRSSTQTQVYVDYDRAQTSLVDWTGYTLDSDFQYDLRLNDIHQLTTGAGLRYQVEKQGNPSSYISYRDTLRHDPLYSAFLQDKIRLVPDQLYLTVGTKIEHNDFTGLEVQPSARLAYYPDDNQTIWASVTRAVRSPSIGEQDAIVKLAGTPGGYVARSFDDGYDSETLIAYELGYRVVPYSQLVLESTVFYNDYSKLRTAELGAPFDDILRPLVPRNNGFGETYGAEFNAKFQARKNWRLQAAYSVMDIKLELNPGVVDPTFSVQEEQTPTHQFSMNSYYNITPDIEFDQSLYYVGKIVSLNSSQPIDGYARLDSRISWHVTEGAEISLIGQNLLDRRHQEYQPSLYSQPTELGRTVFAKVTVGF